MRNTLNTAITNSNTWTSTLTIQGFQRLNVSIRPGLSFVQDPSVSTFSGIVTLQRKFSGEDVWRTVQQWSIVASDGVDGEQEVITSNPEPETVDYRLGIRAAEHYANGCFARLGTS